MAFMKAADELKLGDIVSYSDIKYNIKYVFQSIIQAECMLVERERCDNYTVYKFLIIECCGMCADGNYIYLRYFNESSKLLYLYNVKEIIGCHSAIHR